MMTDEMPAPQPNDVELVAASLQGNQDAFRQIVERYQTLICSLAYCATGSLSQSEDLAQETFVTAWQGLPELREPEKLRSWLCGIVRFRIGKQLRSQGREPAHAAEPMEAMEHSASPETPPADQVITNEERAILWRSLERIPEIYREPLVLFYREQQSIETVAKNLELSGDAVKQRLSRGRKMLEEQVLAFVEGALKRTNPGQTFTLAVLAALPLTFATSAKAATVATAAATGGAVVKGATLGSALVALTGPAAGVAGAYFGARMSLNRARTPRERGYMIRYIKIIILAVVIFSLSLLAFIFRAGPMWKSHPALFIALILGITMSYALFIFISAWRFNRSFARVRDEERQAHPENFRSEPMPTVWEYRSRAKLFGLPLLHFRNGKLPGQRYQPAVGWIAYGEIAFGILYACGGVAVGSISMGGAAIGLVSFGGFGLGLLAVGGIALGGLAAGGAAIGWIASGGLALGWHAAIGGVAAAHELAVGGAAMGNHVNDPVAREFFARYRWLDFRSGSSRTLFWVVCFVPVFLQLAMWRWSQCIARREKTPPKS